MEGFSSEEGFPEKFGTTMFEGHADLGVAPLAADGSFLATVPANVPVHLQAVDKFGMSLFNEPVAWFSGRAGAGRACAAVATRDRSESTIINPGITQSRRDRPRADVPSYVPRAQREFVPATGVTPTADSGMFATAGQLQSNKVVGVAWDTIVQPIFDNNCAMSGCHNATNDAGIAWLHDLEPGDRRLRELGLQPDRQPAPAPRLANSRSATRCSRPSAPRTSRWLAPDMEAIEKAEA